MLSMSGAQRSQLHVTNWLARLPNQPKGKAHKPANSDNDNEETNSIFEEAPSI